MALTFNIKVDTGGVNIWREGVTVAVRKSATMAGISALRAMRAEGSREVRARKGVKVAAFNKAVKLIYPTRKEQLVFAVRAKGEAMKAFAYPHRPTKKGVSVLINRGARALIEHAFIARMRSGHEGIFMRYGTATRAPVQGYKGHARYAGQKRQPIREVFTTTISHAFKDAIPAMSVKGQTVFRATFARVLPLEEAKRRALGRP